MTQAERMLWIRLRGRQLEHLKFRRQHPIGPFVADFCCVERRIIVELDGEHRTMHEANDAVRTAFPQARRFRVIRFWNNEVRDEIESVRARILDAAIRKSPDK